MTNLKRPRGLKHMNRSARVGWALLEALHRFQSAVDLGALVSVSAVIGRSVHEDALGWPEYLDGFKRNGNGDPTHWRDIQISISGPADEYQVTAVCHPPLGRTFVQVAA